MTKRSSTKSKKPTKNKWKFYTIDFDIAKHISKCKTVRKVEWRISASGQGFHFFWCCDKRSCKRCSVIEKQYDDAKRYAHDLQRPRHHRRILWDSKSGLKAGPWNRFSR